MERLTHKARYEAGYKANKDVRVWECIDKLGQLEDKEQSGLLFDLPCKIGSTVYVLTACKNIPQVLDGSYYDATGYYCPYDLYDNCPHKCLECEEAENEVAVFEDTVSYIGIDETEIIIHAENTRVSGNIGEYIFLTREEAEKALAEKE